MAYILYEQQAVAAVVLDVTDLAPPAEATHCELQAETGIVRYTMDGTVPTTSTGMLLHPTDSPKSFLMEDLKAIKFIRNAAASSVLNVHYFGGRAI
jgi:hypothetical protein